ncbi:Ser-Thr-rich glycosyl-phosphatidyl-inositol-anchored membrane family-domain-containing protein [Jimgerdemannia flammicorona]|uniref:Ser-Thr-rich glycosyl-phosphatidyl-inositol-anchored membrane family-domain-containing protein n=1 Tax=Jimgerdemannia flammicorona TaxID=994334 RepID=A0A433QWR3_9FUNG|nr:Ser-Thr-rich glycosyl-phosphatidyl-inositol-anchored membrane family-domain-containing protein [Jimgerdemannia flammicorona]
MKASIIVALLAFVTFATAQNYFITNPVENTTWQAGKTYKITWTDGSDKDISIKLLNGPTPQTQTVYRIIATNVSGNALSYTWTCPTTVPASDSWSVMISDGNVTSYSHPFHVNSGNGTISFSAASTPAAAAVTSSGTNPPTSTAASSAPTAASLKGTIPASSVSVAAASVSANSTSTSTSSTAKPNTGSSLAPVFAFAAIAPLVASLLL